MTILYIQEATKLRRRETMNVRLNWTLAKVNIEETLTHAEKFTKTPLACLYEATSGYFAYATLEQQQALVNHLKENDYIVDGHFVGRKVN